MLILTRKLNESIRIGDIVVKVTAINPYTVRLGIDAPRDVEIVRTELEQHAGTTPVIEGSRL